jgi:hypothetical protein
MVITGKPSGKNDFFSNDPATMFDQNQPLYRPSQRMPWNDPVNSWPSTTPRMGARQFSRAG